MLQPEGIEVPVAVSYVQYSVGDRRGSKEARATIGVMVCEERLAGSCSNYHHVGSLPNCYYARHNCHSSEYRPCIKAMLPYESAIGRIERP